MAYQVTSVGSAATVSAAFVAVQGANAFESTPAAALGQIGSVLITSVLAASGNVRGVLEGSKTVQSERGFIQVDNATVVLANQVVETF